MADPHPLQITAVLCVKNEGPFLLEWIAYHRLIGVSDFVVYTNDCSDGTEALLDLLGGYGVTRLDNPAQTGARQMQALRHASNLQVVREADWLWIADVDEFPNIHVGDGTFYDLISACGQPQAISLCFQFFSNCNIAAFHDRPVIAQFDHSHNPDLWNIDPACEVKTLVHQSLPRRYLGAHRPYLKDSISPKAPPHWTDGSGQQVPNAFIFAEKPVTTRKLPAKGARRFATLNHYALRSLDSYMVKAARGDINRPDRLFDEVYWQDRNDPAYQDLSIQRHLPDLEVLLSDMKSDPQIAAAHEACVRAHRDQIMAQSAMPDYQRLRKTIRATPTRPPREQALINRLRLEA